MSATARRGVLVDRQVSMLRGQLLGALAIGWALGCGGLAESSDQSEGDEREANRSPSPPIEGCPSGDAQVECYPLLVLDSIARGREASGQFVPATYTSEGCVNADIAVAASNAYSCGPYPAGEPVLRGDACCYHHCQSSPGCGRPFIVAGEARVAGASASLDWLSDATLRGVAAPADAAAVGTSAIIGGEWLRDALAEHASVASFSAFNLSLLALGAPAALVRASAAAALDEVFHASACFELARQYSGHALGPAPLRLDQLRIDTDLVTVAERAFIDGCLGETVAALVAHASLEACDQPRVRAVLERIARDEASHAELAWQFVAWALRRGGDDVARALSNALATASVAATACQAGDPAPAEWHRAGRLSASEHARLTEQALHDIIHPMLATLLSRHHRLAPAEGQRSRGGLGAES